MFKETTYNNNLIMQKVAKTSVTVQMQLDQWGGRAPGHLWPGLALHGTIMMSPPVMKPGV